MAFRFGTEAHAHLTKYKCTVTPSSGARYALIGELFSTEGIRRTVLCAEPLIAHPPVWNNPSDFRGRDIKQTARFRIPCYCARKELYCHTALDTFWRQPEASHEARRDLSSGLDHRSAHVKPRSRAAASRRAHRLGRGEGLQGPRYQRRQR